MSLLTFNIKQLLVCGVHQGVLFNRWNPEMSRYLLGMREGFFIIRVDLTLYYLRTALLFVKYLTIGKKQTLMFGNFRLIKEVNNSLKQPFVYGPTWGGVITNIREFQRYVSFMKKNRKSPKFYIRLFLHIILLFRLIFFLKHKKRWYKSRAKITSFINLILKYNKKGYLSSRYILTLKKRLKLYGRRKGSLSLRYERNLDFYRFLLGIRHLRRLDAVFICNVNRYSYVVRDANKLAIPIIGIIDSNSSNIGNINYFIPGNATSLKSLNLYVILYYYAVLEGRLKQHFYFNYRLRRIGKRSKFKVNTFSNKTLKKNQYKNIKVRF